MTVFRYIEDKDVFQTFYSKFLARRLVNNSSASDDAEAQMIGRLKVRVYGGLSAPFKIYEYQRKINFAKY